MMPQEAILDDGSELDEMDSTDIKMSPLSSHVQSGLILYGLAIPIVLLACNMVILTTMQSVVVLDLDCDSAAPWLNLAYLIPLSSFMPLAGRLCDIFGAKMCLLTASMTMTIGSWVTGLAPNSSVFILGRLITGLGAASVTPTSIGLVVEISSKKNRGTFIGLVNSGFTLGVALGSVSAGLLLQLYGWRAVFLVQSPLLALAVLCIYIGMPNHRPNSEGISMPTVMQQLQTIDYLGSFTLTTALVLLCLGLASSTISKVLLLLSFILILKFIMIETYFSDSPMIPMKILRSRHLICVCIAQLNLMSARWIILFYTPIYAIAVLDKSPTTAGLILVPANIGFAIGGLCVGLLHIRSTGSYCISSLLSIAGFALSLGILAYLSNSDSPISFYLMITLFINGFCTSATLSYTITHLLYQINEKEQSVALAVLATFRGFAGSVGSVIGGVVFSKIFVPVTTRLLRRKNILDRNDLVHKVLRSPGIISDIEDQEEKEIFIHAFRIAVAALFVFTTFLALVALMVQSGTGSKEDKNLSVEDGDDVVASIDERQPLLR